MKQQTIDRNKNYIWDGNADAANEIFGEAYTGHWAYVSKECSDIKVGNVIYKIGDVIPADWKNKLLREAADLLIKYLNDWYHPHAIAIVSPTSVEICEGVQVIPNITDHVSD